MLYYPTKIVMIVTARFDGLKHFFSWHVIENGNIIPNISEFYYHVMYRTKIITSAFRHIHFNHTTRNNTIYCSKVKKQTEFTFCLSILTKIMLMKINCGWRLSLSIIVLNLVYIILMHFLKVKFTTVFTMLVCKFEFALLKMLQNQLCSFFPCNLHYIQESLILNTSWKFYNNIVGESWRCRFIWL